VNVSLSDLTQLATFAQRVDPHPVRLSGRMLGLTPEEQQQVPPWGWMGLALGAGIGIGIIAYRYFLPSSPGSR
jgi:hypothetical protein